MLKVAEKLFELHKKGIIHRELKPENIIINNLGNIYIIDSKLESNLSITNDDVKTKNIGSPF